MDIQVQYESQVVFSTFSAFCQKATPLDLTEASPLDVFVHRLEDGTFGKPWWMVDGGEDGGSFGNV